MSIFTAVGKELPRLKVTIKSALEEALEAMPNNKMSPEDIANGLKNRGVQKLEIEQSGVANTLKKGYIDNPKQLLEGPNGIKTSRPDVYTTKEYRGTIINNIGNNLNVTEQTIWSTLLRRDGAAFEEPTQESINKYIIRNRNYLARISNDSTLVDEITENIDTASDLLNTISNTNFDAKNFSIQTEIYDLLPNELPDFINTIELLPQNKLKLIDEYINYTNTPLSEISELIEEVKLSVNTTKYDFGRQAYKDYALPDTNDASYYTRVYKNSAVDKKGFDYSAHFDDKDVIKNGVFHVRGDDPQPNVRRIMEIQSDIQNAMLGAKKEAIEKWRNTSKEFSKSELLIPRSGESDIIISTRAQINRELYPNIDAIAKDKGIGTGYLSSVNIADFIINNKLNTTNLSNNATKAIKMWARALDDDIFSTDEVMQELAKTSNLTVSEVVKVRDEVFTFIRKYKNKTSKIVNNLTDTTKLRVTPEDRLYRIKLGGDNATTKEIALREESINNSINYINTKYKLNINPKDITSQAYIRQNVLQNVVGKSLKEIANDTVNIILYNASTVARMTAKQDIRDATVEGLDYVAKAYPDLPDITKIAKEATDIANDIVSKDLKNLEPLEKFPSANKFNLPIPYIKQGFQEEINRAIQEGKQEVWLTVNPPKVEKLSRGTIPQSNYENGGNINKTFRNTAKRYKAEIIEEDGYLKMLLPDSIDKQNHGSRVAAGATAIGGTIAISAYADTNTQDKIAVAREAGYSDSQINEYLAKNSQSEIENPLAVQQALNQGFTQEQIDKYQQNKFIREMDETDFVKHPGTPFSDPTFDDPANISYNKLPVDVIRNIAIDIEADPSTPIGIDAIYEEVMYRENPGLREYFQEKADTFFTEQTRSDIADFIELYDYWSPSLWLRAQIGSGPAEEAYKAKKQKLAENVIKTGEEHGYDLILGQNQELNGVILNSDEWYVKLENGNVYNATPGFLASISREGGEILGGTGGAIAGAVLVNKYTQGFEALPLTRLLKFGAITTSIIAGAMLGDQIDYASAAIRQQEQYNWKTAADKALGSAQVSVLGEVVGYGIFKFGAASWRAAMRAYNFAMNGNVDGAFDILLRSLDMTEEQAKEVVARWEQINMKEAPTLADNRKWYNPRKYTGIPDKEKAIAVLPVTKAGGEHIAPAIGESNPRASAAMVSEINQRAKSLVRASAGNLDDSGVRATAVEIIDSVGTYKNEVGDFYSITKQHGGELVPKGYSFNFKGTAIKPLLDDIMTRIYPPNQRQAAANMLERIDKLTTTRTFEDLIELRQIINEISGRKSTKPATWNALATVRTNIDDEIERVSTLMGPDGSQWYKDWLTAKADYSEMKKLTSSALAKTLQRPGINEKVVAQALIKYGTALDGTYDDLIKQLPLKTQSNIEALIIDNLVMKATDGNVTQLQATNFPMLRDALADYDFIWPESKALKSVVDQFAEIYQNDNALSYASGGIATTKFQSYLTTDPVVRAQFEIASKFFNQIKILMGGGKGDAAALIKLSAKLLEDPLNPNNVEQALKAVQGKAALESAIKRLSTETAAARQAGRSVTIKIKTYKDDSGKLWTIEGTGRTRIDDIPRHRITSEEVAKTILQADDLKDLSRMDRARLINKGFTHIGLDDGTIIVLN